jgi:hypothetical protein
MEITRPGSNLLLTSILGNETEILPAIPGHAHTLACLTHCEGESNVKESLVRKIDADAAAKAFEAAKQLDTEERTKRVVDGMKEQIANLRKLQDDKSVIESMIDLTEKRLKALELGQFKIGANEAIVYDDPDLRKKFIDHHDGRKTHV